jgi:hypothetical protein
MLPKTAVVENVYVIFDEDGKILSDLFTFQICLEIKFLSGSKSVLDRKFDTF